VPFVFAAHTHMLNKGDTMPLSYMLIIIAIVIVAAGITVAVMQGFGLWIVIPTMAAALGLRAWIARK
jgi:hypothetical protein